MARLKTTLARALILYVALLPLLGAAAEVRGEPQIVGTPRPFDPPGPPVPRRPPGETVFAPAAEPLTLRAFNGFRSDATPGEFRHHGHGHPGGVAAIDSPWGERLDIRYWFSPQGVTLEYDADLKVRYHFAEDGTLAEIVAETPEREARMEVGNRAELAYLGHRDFESFDLSAYQLIEESLRAKHSDAFLTGLAELDAPAEASCLTQGVQCIACILGWVGSVAGIIAACTAGSVPTMGMACAAAILAHEGASLSCAVICGEWMRDCLRARPPQDPPIQGCEP